MKKIYFRITLIVFVLYCILVCLVGFWPTPIDGSMGGAVESALSWLHRHGMPKFIDYNFIEFSSNILFFVPMGMIMGLWIKRKIATILISTYVSIAIEVIQELVLPQRFSTVFDIVANTFGSAIGLFRLFRIQGVNAI
ncbi:VanZ family protein [Glutamicibacter arilaitensis]|uniref:VanZ family protein n=1 Tax=Glutamicibacter arilaitensis TaxID=256701 RepID=UPI003FD2FD48